MAFYCIDYINGSNVTGDGTASAPWATIEHGNAQINGGAGYISGDEMRVAGSTLGTQLDSNMTINASASGYVRLNTNVDLTGSISVGDYVRFTTTSAYPTSAMDKFSWCVEAITATTIQIHNENSAHALWNRFPTQGAPNFAIQKINNVPTFDVNGFSGYYLDQPNTISNNFEDYGDDVIISGGWDPANFTTKTNLGRTVIGRAGTYQAASAFAYGGMFRSTIGFSGIKFQDFNPCRTYVIDYQTSGVWNKGCNFSSIASANSFARVTGTTPASFVNPRVCDDISMRKGGLFSVFSPNITQQFDNSFFYYTETSTTSSQYAPLGTGGEYTSLGNNVVLVGQTYDISFMSTYTTSAADTLKYTYLPVDFATTTIVWGSTSRFQFLPSQGTSPTTQPKLGNILSVPSSFLATFSDITVGSLASQYNYSFEDLDVLPRWSDEPNLIAEASRRSKITETNSGITYDFGGYMYTRLNETDNATGTNCIEFRPTVIKSASTGRIAGNWMPIIANKGQTIDVTISGKILGATASLAPTLKLQSLSSDTQGNYAYLNPTGTSSFNGGSNEDFTTVSGSFNNSTYTDMTFQITVLDAETLNRIYQQFSLYWDISGFPAGDRLLVDEVTYTIT